MPMQRCHVTRRWRRRSLTAALLALMVPAGCGQRNQDRLSDTRDGTPRQSARNTPDGGCSSKSTYELVKREMFRRAAQVRGEDDPTFEPVVAGSTLSLDKASARSADSQVGSITCTASAALSLPAGMVAAGGRNALAADISYVLQQAADQSGPVVTLTNADSITVPLATIARGANAMGPSSGGAEMVSAENEPDTVAPTGPSRETPPVASLSARQARPVPPAISRPMRDSSEPMRARSRTQMNTPSSASADRREMEAVPVARARPRSESAPPVSGNGGGWRLAQVIRQGPLNTKIYIDERSLDQTSDGRVRVRTKYVGVLQGQAPVQTFTDETVECDTGFHTQHSYLVRNAQGGIVAQRGAQPRKRILPNAMLRGLMNRLCS